MKTNRSALGPQVPRDGDLSLIRRLLRDYLGRQKLNLVFAILCMAGGAAMTALLAWLLDPAIRYVFFEKRTDMVLLIPMAIVAAVSLPGRAKFFPTAPPHIFDARLLRDHLHG